MLNSFLSGSRKLIVTVKFLLRFALVCMPKDISLLLPFNLKYVCFSQAGIADVRTDNH